MRNRSDATSDEPSDALMEGSALRLRQAPAATPASRRGRGRRRRQHGRTDKLWDVGGVTSRPFTQSQNAKNYSR